MSPCYRLISVVECSVRWIKARVDKIECCSFVKMVVLRDRFEPTVGEAIEYITRLCGL